MRQEADNWFRSAKNDLETAKYNMEGGKLDAAAFYAQQAVEKSLKSIQIEKLGKFQRTHDLVLLGKSVDAPKEILKLCEMIEPFYTITRYPDSAVDYNPGVVGKLLEASEKVVKWTQSQLTKT